MGGINLQIFFNICSTNPGFHKCLCESLHFRSKKCLALRKFSSFSMFAKATLVSQSPSLIGAFPFKKMPSGGAEILTNKNKRYRLQSHSDAEGDPAPLHLDHRHVASCSFTFFARTKIPRFLHTRRR